MGEKKGNLGIFSALPQTIRRELEKSFEPKTYKAGEIVFREGTVGDGVFIVRSGRIMLYSFSPRGERKIFDLIVEGDVIGEMAMIDGEPRSMTAEAITDVSLDFIAKGAFEQGVLRHKEAVLPFLQLVVRRLRRLDQHVEEIIFQGVPSRVAAAINYLANRFGENTTDDEGKPIVRLNITHAEIADLVGTSREYASKFIAQFQSDGLLRCGRGTIDIYNLDGIKAWAQ